MVSQQDSFKTERIGEQYTFQNKALKITEE